MADPKTNRRLEAVTIIVAFGEDTSGLSYESIMGWDFEDGLTEVVDPNLSEPERVKLVRQLHDMAAYIEKG